MTHQTMQNNLNSGLYKGPDGSKFYQDLINLFGLEDNEISHKMYQLAWKNGHAYGYEEVYYHFTDLVEVFKS